VTSFTFQAEQLAKQANQWSVGHHSGGDGSEALAGALAAEGLVHAVLSVSEQLRQLVAAQTPPAPPTVVYRAYFETMPLGLYSTREAARAHCLADAKNHGDDVTKAHWWPQDDDPDGSEECLVLQAPPGGDLLTDYSVMPLTVAAAYDPDAEG
jgi:hypothetical protein